ncbi:outer membrane protein transport protein [Gallaecimonas sp. GXIMD4217]|uniref:OmpP1/FadL family transporter n=1 Tax=Gallaecimonas sp. GXIMD4217 TaxID=3131927 RepID=UPI00311B3A24
MQYRLSLLAAALLSTTAQAAGYKIFEQSTSSMGSAYAGRGALVEDATVVYSNPAAMSRLGGSELVGGLSLVSAEVAFDNASATDARGLQVQGKSADTLEALAAIPHFYYHRPLSERIHFGLALVVPYGVESDYDDDFVGRYFADESRFEILSLQPTLSYALDQAWSVGLGINLNHAEGKLSKFKDHGGLCQLPDQYVNQLYGMISGGAFTQVAQDGYCRSHYSVEGDDFGVGMNVGIHYQPSDKLQLGLAWHSQVHYRLKGDSEITHTPISGEFVPEGAPFWVAPTIPGVVDGQKLPAVDLATNKLAINDRLVEASQLSLTTPQSLMLSGAYQQGDWTWLATANWTDWSQFQSIRVESRAGFGPISVSTSQAQNLNEAGLIGYIPEHWQDAWAYAVGLHYRLDEAMKLRLGYALDESPIPDSHRTARIPSSDRQWFTLGLGWQLAPQWQLDLAYGYMFMDDVRVEEREFNAQDQALYQSGYQADYEIDAHVLSAQLAYRF